MTCYEQFDERKKKVLALFVDSYLKNNDSQHILGMVLCGSFKNDK